MIDDDPSAAHPAPAFPPLKNRLAGEKSPYLLQHAQNPVAWQPWGEEAFARARAEEKPIFLSVGYSTCHWCHVMAHESFENEAIAELLNAHFVPVKVDREERPDVDRVYMTFVQATTGSGGWPMSVWLTPALQPFMGGTYFPPQDRPGRAGFPTLLIRIAEAWRTDRRRIIAHGEQMIATLSDYSRGHHAPSADLHRDTIEQACATIAQNFDPERGGFGTAPKFPRPVTLNLLFRAHAGAIDSGADREHALHMALLTLRRMAAGGMHDQLGGGFHRYSVDAAWHVPHFEKMLYDQAQLAVSYLEAFQITRDPFFERIARDTLDYVLRDLRDPAGGFHSAEDADSLVEPGGHEQAEGAFYVWTRAEIVDVLGADAAMVFNRVHGVEENGNAPAGSDPQGEFRGKNILLEREDATALAASRALLLARRNQRPRPHRDDKIITSWNGLMISALARAAQILHEEVYLEAATGAAAFLRTGLQRDDGTLLRSYRDGPGRVEGFAEDYAFLIQALLDLYETRGDAAHLKWALELQASLDTLFLDPAHGGYFGASDRDQSILIRLKEDYDGAEPSPNSIAALNLLRLGEITGRPEFRAAALRTLQAFAPQLEGLPSAMPQMLVALDFAESEPVQIILTGQADDPRRHALARVVHETFLPHRVLIFAEPGSELPAATLPFLPRDPDTPAAYLCRNSTCQLPTSDPAQLRDLLAEPPPAPPS